MLQQFGNRLTPANLFRISLLFLLADRIIVLLLFGFQYTGSDDVLLWNIGNDYANGIFHEPFMYRQNYNPALESLLAVPLLWLHIPPHIAFPLLTTALAIIPFVSFAYWFKRKGNIPAGILLLLVPVLLSPHYAILTTIPRGFVTGIFLLSFYPLIDLIKKLLLRRILFGFVCMLALAVNPNALFLIIPLFIYELQEKKNVLIGLPAMAAGALPVIGLHYLALQFYETHPIHLLHRLSPDQLKFDPALLASVWEKRDLLFKGLMPLFPGLGWLLVLVFPMLAVVAFRQKNTTVLWSSIFVFILVIISCGFPKIHDGSPAVFFHSSRMFLALPFVAGLLALWLKPSPAFTQRINYQLFLLPAILLVFRIFSLPAYVDTTMEKISISPVHERKVKEVCEECDSVYAVARREKAELIMAFYAPGFELDHAKYIDLGCVVYHPDLPVTLMPEYERRAWIDSAELKLPTIHKRILIFTGGRQRMDSLTKVYPNFRRCCDKPLLYMVEDNDLKTLEVYFRYQFKE